MNTFSRSVKYNRSDWFVGICLLLGLFLPHTSVINMLVCPFLCLVLALSFRNSSQIHFTAKWMMIMSIVVSFLLNAASGAVGFKTYLSVINLTFLFICFPFANGQRIPISILFCAVGFILLSQLIYIFHIQSLVTLFDKWYPVSPEYSGYFNYVRENVSFSNFLDFRLDGFSRNANQTARYLSLLMVCFCCDNNHVLPKRRLLFFLLVAWSIVMTGSRTGLLLFVVILIFFIKNDNTISRVSKRWVVAVVTVLAALFMVTMGGRTRGLNVAGGMNDSIIPKWNVFMNYMGQEHTIMGLLFGHLDPGRFSPSKYGIMRIFDSEYGDWIYCYGLVGFYIVIRFVLALYKRVPKEYRQFFLIFLWSISSTLFMSFRMSFVLMLSCSVIFTTNFVGKNSNRESCPDC